MAELVAKSAEEGSVRGHLLAHGSAGPNADQRGLQIVISEQLDGAAFAHAQRTSGEDADFGPLDPVEVGGYGKEVAAGVGDGCGLPLCMADSIADARVSKRPSEGTRRAMCWSLPRNSVSNFGFRGGGSVNISIHS